MPCGDCGQTEYYEKRRRMSTVLSCLDELETGQVDPSHFDEHPLVKYHGVNNGWIDKHIDSMTAELCEKLSLHRRHLILNYSLELQKWWIDHQIEDAKRTQREDF